MVVDLSEQRSSLAHVSLVDFAEMNNESGESLWTQEINKDSLDFCMDYFGKHKNPWANSIFVGGESLREFM